MSRLCPVAVTVHSVTVHYVARCPGQNASGPGWTVGVPVGVSKKQEVKSNQMSSVFSKSATYLQLEWFFLNKRFSNAILQLPILLCLEDIVDKVAT